MYPTGILQNTKTGRFHPIAFRPAPLPSEADRDMGALRHKSIGHHTAGFETLELAKADIADRGWKDCGTVWEWDGEDVPAMIEWFSTQAAT
jgi:hypothetical protein